MLAEVGVGGLMEVPAGAAALDLGDVDAGAVVTGGQADAVDLVAGALVVDERAGAELADRHEPGPLDEVAFPAAAGAPFRRNERRQRQPRERIAGQEAFRGEVAVGVEITLKHVVDLALEEVEGSTGLRNAAAGTLFRAFGRADGFQDLCWRWSSSFCASL